MSGYQVFEHPESDRETLGYRTYDDRIVSREEVERAIRRSNRTVELLITALAITLITGLIVIVALVVWFFHS